MKTLWIYCPNTDICIFTNELFCNQLQTFLVQIAEANTTKVTTCIHKLQCLSPDTFFKMLGAHILCMLYIHRKYVKLTFVRELKLCTGRFTWFPNLHIRVPSLMVYWETGRYSVFVNEITRSVRHRLKIVCVFQENSRYLHITNIKLMIWVNRVGGSRIKKYHAHMALKNHELPKMLVMKSCS